MRISGSLRYLYRRGVLCVFNGIAFLPHFQPVQKIRASLLRSLRCVVGSDVQFSESFYVLNGANLEIDDGVRLGSFCRIWDFSRVLLGRRLLASHNLTIVAGTHDAESLADLPGPVVIEEDVWIGTNVTIVGPVVIGCGTIVGAGSVVLKDLPRNTICAGVPCKVIRTRDKADRSNLRTP